jgi:DNA polymerase/3'-5' exonuclease PolX
MNFAELSKAFRARAEEISKTNADNAKFRVKSYNRVANLIDAVQQNETPVTSDLIGTLEISDYMKTIAMKFVDGTVKKPKIKKSKNTKTAKSKNTPSKSKTIVKAKVKVSRDANVEPTDTTKKTSKSISSKSVSPTNHTKLLKELQEFMGIGPERAKELINAGVTHINQLHMKKYKDLLPAETKIFIDLKPLQQIPNEHIKVLEPYLLKASDKNLKLTIVGSYRRGKPFSSDIDLMVVSNESNAIELLLERLKEILNGKIYPYSKGPDKLSLIVDMSELIGSKNLIYKIDAFRTLPEHEIPMLLYSTGSKEFNVVMRGKAKKAGYLLNQKGLFKDGVIIKDLNTEKDYFDILGISYKEPSARI